MEPHATVSRDEWLAARTALLAKEKELTRANDELSRQRRALPWVKVEKHYVFEAPGGQQTLADLFDGRSQLIVKHFMFGPDWEEGCTGCSFHADHVDGAFRHLEHHDVSFVAISRAPLEKIAAFKKRMGWRFRWVSSGSNDFNFDYNVSFTPEQIADGRAVYNYRKMDFEMDEMPGLSVFYKDQNGEVFHTYSCYARGADPMIGAYRYLDIVPKGRDENGPGGNLTDWVRHHDKYDDAAPEPCCAL